MKKYKNFSLAILCLIVCGCSNKVPSSTSTTLSTSNVITSESLVSSDTSIVTTSVTPSTTSVVPSTSAKPTTSATSVPTTSVTPSTSAKPSSSSTPSTSKSSEVHYATWPTDTIQYLCTVIDEECTEIIPSFDFANEIEINTDYLLDEEFFGIYCYVDSKQESENIYSKKLKDSGWKVSDEKIEDYLEAYSPNNIIWLNFHYDAFYKDLEIYVTKAPITSWPTELVAENVNRVLEGTKTVILPFEAELYTVNFYPSYLTLAINGYGVDENIVNTYKNSLISANWEVESGFNEGEFIGIAPDKDIQVTFYYVEEKDEFNVDVQRHTQSDSKWPADEIAAIVADMGLTGTVMEYQGEYNSAEPDDNYFPPCVYVYVENGKQTSSANEYNQMLLNNGYVLAGTMYGDPAYCYPGTTLAYRAVYLLGSCFTIEMFDVATLDK